MLTHPMLDQLHQLGLPGVAQAFSELEASGDAATLSHADWLGLLLDREVTHRRDKPLPASFLTIWPMNRTWPKFEAHPLVFQKRRKFLDIKTY